MRMLLSGTNPPSGAGGPLSVRKFRLPVRPANHPVVVSLSLSSEPHPARPLVAALGIDAGGVKHPLGHCHVVGLVGGDLRP